MKAGISINTSYYSTSFPLKYPKRYAAVLRFLVHFIIKLSGMHGVHSGELWLVGERQITSLSNAFANWLLPVPGTHPA